MRKTIAFLSIFFCFQEVGFAFSTAATDSVGTIIKGGQDFILHEVEPGETLFALSRKYEMDVQSIKDANTESLNSLKVGQKVLIPFRQKNIEMDGRLHTVQSSETLFSISREYNIKVEDLKQWNDLNDNAISVGQKLIIGENDSNSKQEGQSNQASEVGRSKHTVEQSQTLYSVSRMYGVSTLQLIEWNNLESDALKIGQVLVVSNPEIQVEAVESPNSSMLPETEIKSESKEAPVGSITTGGIVAAGADVSSDSEEKVVEEPKEKVVQKGMAEVIENTSETKKYLALHREAPVGTIMQVRNKMNDQSVFVRVVGPISPTGDSAKVILKISKKAYDRLGAVDNRFPVEISYIP